MKVETEITVVDGVIRQLGKYHFDYDETTNFLKVVKKVIDTEDEQIKQVLIKLGWTPPPIPKKRKLCVFPSLNHCLEAFDCIGLDVEKNYFRIIASNENEEFHYRVVENDCDFLKLKGTRWDDIWIHPDVKYGLAQQILSLKRD